MFYHVFARMCEHAHLLQFNYYYYNNQGYNYNQNRDWKRARLRFTQVIH